MDVIQSFKKTVERYRLFHHSDKLLIAISGGSDSVALCHICHELGYDIGVAHINYQLRGEDSNEDALLVEMIAKKLGIAGHIKTIDCKSYAAEHSLSIQEAAREVRYDFFDSIIAMHDYDHVLTAHHAKDNVETMIYTLVKGAALTGIRGIPISRDNIKRPLLHTTKAAIDLYLRRHAIDYRHDISNDETKYYRNYIRHEIIPKLEQINPNLESTLSRTSMLGHGYQLLLDEVLAEQRTNFHDSKKLDLKPMEGNPGMIAWLYELIHTLGFNFTDVLDISATLDKKHSTGKTFRAGTNVLTIDRGYLHLSTISEDNYPENIVINSIETASKDTNNRFHLNVKETLPVTNGAFFDLDRLTFPLTIRPWKAGDRFRPSGMQGKSKKVKDYLTDQKVSGPARKAVEVMLSQGEIVWVVGYRTSDGFKASTNSKSILSITHK